MGIQNLRIGYGNTENKLYLFEANNTGKYNNEKFKSCSLYVIANGDKLLIDYFI
jgi:hypothetical protein